MERLHASDRLFPAGTLLFPDDWRLIDIEDAHAFAQAIVDTVREPLLVLDGELRVIAASRSFYLTFAVRPEDTQGRFLHALGNGQWDIPALRALLEQDPPRARRDRGFRGRA